MKVSIIVPIYNAELTLERLFISIENQSYKNYEVILVNDGSTDLSEDLCRIICERNKKFSYHYQENNGVSSARNAGLKLIKDSQLISFVDSDDFLELNYLEDLVRPFLENDDISLAICGYKRSNEIYFPESKLANSEEVLHDLVVNSSIKGYLHNKMFRYEVLKKNKILLDESIHFAEDLLFCIEYLQYISKVQYISKALYNYVQGNGNITSVLYSSKKVTYLESLKKCIKILNGNNLSKKSSIEYKTLLAHVATSLWWHGRGVYNKKELDVIINVLNEIRIEEIRGYSIKLRVIFIRLII